MEWEWAQTEEEIENAGIVASPPKSSRHFLDTQYGIHNDGVQLMSGDSPVFIDPDDNNITIKGTVFRETEGMWELLTRKNVNSQLIDKGGLKDI